MRGTLRALNATLEGMSSKVPSSVNDVTVEFTHEADLSTGSEIKATVAEPNGGLENRAYVVGLYPIFEVEGNLYREAEIVSPRKGVPGILPVGAKLTIKVAQRG